MHTRITRRERLGKAPSEHTEGVRLMRALTLQRSAHPVLWWFFHIPNGGWRKKAVAAKLKGEGVKPGVADYCLPAARGQYHGLFLELKAQGGSKSAEQREFAEFVLAQGYQHVFCTGWESAYSAVMAYLSLPSPDSSQS